MNARAVVSRLGFSAGMSASRPAWTAPADRVRRIETGQDPRPAFEALVA